MKTSNNGIGFIRSHEGCVLTAYHDGGGVWTIGVGHTKGVKEGQTITQDQADQFLADDLVPVETCINGHIAVTLNQNQFDALASFIFNLGEFAFTGSTLLKKLNAGDYTGAANEFPKWDHDNGEVVQGLLNRRLDEKELFLS
ncbi:lysozyme [Leclercia adecarboxylata]|uniref:lysozyme n=1 Tax=Leclercia adecarboxylata TaxID=83655 RepID=UPI00202A8AE5|nr:lysozyme [Leclercia adecarboxylata]URO00941.1 lysozyme [Leclercia adecarboxylata]